MRAIFTSLALVTLSSSVLSLPSERRDDGSTLTEIQALNFALSLEHFQYYFYQRLYQYGSQDFSNAGLPPWTPGRYAQISSHELTHAQFLENILGDKAVQPCTYNFPDTDPRSFVKTSNIVEAIASSAYTSLTKYISNPDYAIAISSIHSVEARHSAWINADVRLGAAWSTAFDAPLSVSQLYTMMSTFIASCPSSNSPPPVKIFPVLTFPANVVPGQTVQVSFSSATPEHGSQRLYAWFISGFEALVIPLHDDMTVTIPNTLQGFVFSVITNSREAVSDDATVAGPAFLLFDYDYQGNDQSLPM
ncbi:ferritin-like domain-containing protein [Suillus clintonianus]|uniref:ferritin-like domain-containing protein n=1 Tax=Suillus clintonianus TaxID=1904413 RepID=UPI001B86980B|nr:ferritin-like domain-containing protein [Suillus clintonianus]KAG2127121.1 ferritin-like domain-containing protein [Suillus clintonianus]